MRLELLYNPRLLLERLASASLNRRRLARLRRTIASHLLPGHISSLELLELLRSEPPAIIFDIGANVGTWTLLAKAIFPSATVHSFEPFAEHQEAFVRATARIPNVNLHKIALGAEAKSQKLNVTDFSDASSLLELTAEGRSLQGLQTVATESVEVTVLDNYVSANALPLPDLIKLDVQGYELEVLKGASKCLQHAQALILEVSFRELYEGQCLFHDVVEFCGPHGFYLSAVADDIAAGQRLVQTDVLFERTHQSGVGK
jgi:FkbM family methyltransferase